MADPRIGPVGGGPLHYMLRPLGISASGMSAYRQRMETIAGNIANAETTSTPEGGPYQRRVAVLGSGGPHNDVGVSEIATDTRPGPLVYDPGHPDANENGYVQYPNVDITTELVDLMVSRRIFEANATVFEAAKAILRRALEI